MAPSLRLRLQVRGFGDRGMLMRLELEALGVGLEHGPARLAGGPVGTLLTLQKALPICYRAFGAISA
jgi:hypothetical protein